VRESPGSSREESLGTIFVRLQWSEAVDESLQELINYTLPVIVRRLIL
jgi:hypothetical protein